MSRKRLVQRVRDSPNQSSPTQNVCPRPQRETSETELPPYKPPCFLLSAEAKRKLEELYLHHDFTKYKKNIKDATNIVTKSTYECNDRLWQRKQKLRSMEEKVKTSENIDEVFKARYKKEKAHVNNLEGKVGEITSKAENAIRDLIDYGDELSMQSHFLQTVVKNHVSRQSLGSNAGVSDQDGSAPEQTGQRCVEILRSAKIDYKTKYENKSKKDRYAEHNDYKNFKGMIHDAQNQGPNARPLENPIYWFPDELSHKKGTTENEEDEIIMTSATTNLKCSFTLQYFKEPYSNRKCKHTYEKSAILDYLNTGGTMPNQSGRRGQPQGNKTITCPTPGCSVTLGHDDFFLDERIQQQVAKAKRFEDSGNHQDESDDDDVERLE